MKDLVDIHLGRRLRRRRRILGLTQQQLASACIKEDGESLRFQQIQKYECAANRMSAARLWQLAEVLEVPVSYFYEGLSPDMPAQDREIPEPKPTGVDSNNTISSKQPEPNRPAGPGPGPQSVTAKAKVKAL